MPHSYTPHVFAGEEGFCGAGAVPVDLGGSGVAVAVGGGGVRDGVADGGAGDGAVAARLLLHLQLEGVTHL